MQAGGHMTPFRTGVALSVLTPDIRVLRKG